jgi:hypothetical protein
MGMPVEQSASAEPTGAVTVRPTADAPTKAVLESRCPSSKRLFFDMESPRSLKQSYQNLWVAFLPLQRPPYKRLRAIKKMFNNAFL